MSDTGTLMWFIATTAGLITILALFVVRASRADPHQRHRWHSKWPTGPWP